MGGGCATSFPGAGENPGNEVWLYEVYDGRALLSLGTHKEKLECSWAPGTLKF